MSADVYRLEPLAPIPKTREQARCSWCQWFAGSRRVYSTRQDAIINSPHCLRPDATVVACSSLNADGRCPEYRPSRETVRARSRLVKRWRYRLPVMVPE